MDKSGLRARMRDIGVTDSGREQQVVTHLQTWMSARLPGTVAAYLAMSSEVDVSSLFETLPGWRWVLPRVEPDRSLTFRDRDVGYELHEFGIRQPIDQGVTIPIHEIDLFLVPGLAFDHTGGRLGWGAGYYDKVLSRKRSDSLAIGVTTKSHVVDAVPMSDHDQAVGWLATEDGVTECLPRN